MVIATDNYWASTVIGVNMSFITVVYGDNEHRMFNSHCTAVVLLECIRKYCKADDNVILDLTDSIGNIKHLPDHLTAYANIFLEGRATYWLIKVEKGNTDDNTARYSLLINNSETYYPDLTNKLAELSRPPSRTTPTSGRKESGWTSVRKKLPRPSVKGSKRSTSSLKKRWHDLSTFVSVYINNTCTMIRWWYHQNQLFRI